MTKYVIVLFCFGTLFGLAMLSSCETLEDCQLDPASSEAIVQLIDIDSLDRTTFTVNFIELVLENGTMPLDTIISNGVGIELPLDEINDSVQYLISLDETVFDLTIRYNTEIRFFDVECDPSVFFIDLQASSETLDSVAVVVDELDRRLTTENIEIYF